MRNKPKIEVLAIEPVGRGSLLAVLTLRLPGGTILNKCRLIRQPNRDAPSVSPPTESWLDADGRRRYKALAVWPPQLRAEISAAGAAAWRDFQQAQGAESEGR